MTVKCGVLLNLSPDVAGGGAPTPFWPQSHGYFDWPVGVQRQRQQKAPFGALNCVLFCVLYNVLWPIAKLNLYKPSGGSPLVSQPLSDIGFEFINLHKYWSKGHHCGKINLCHYLEHCYVQGPTLILHFNWKSVPASRLGRGLRRYTSALFEPRS